METKHLLQSRYKLRGWKGEKVIYPKLEVRFMEKKVFVSSLPGEERCKQTRKICAAKQSKEEMALMLSA
jgi:hypothetical protein